MGSAARGHGAALGVDVGGANLKWARASRAGGGGRPADGSDLASGVLPFQLWRDPGALPRRLREVDRLASGRAGDGRPGVVALSLTGELADCFADRAEGVRHIVGSAREVWEPERLRVFCRDGAWRRPAAVADDPARAAAANWRAPAEWLARRGEDVLLADMGSTTTDLVPVRGGTVASAARTDLERLRAGELVYTGLLRTPVCAMVREVELPEGTVPVAAERFAQAADVHLWLGSLAPEEYRCETPDGGPATREAAGRRLARMVCAGPAELGDEGVDALARAAAEAQARRVVEAIERQRRGGGSPPREGLPTGAGADLVAAHLRRAGLELRPPPPALGGEHAAASTATTLALLALEEGP